MLALGIVERVVDEYTVKVRIPILHRSPSDVNATPTDLLPDASICTFSKSYPNYIEGCVVVVGFDRNDLTAPIILGELMTDKDIGNETGMRLTSLEVNGSCTLPIDTSVGEVNSHDISCIKGTRVNIQSQLDNLEERISALEEG